MTDLSRVVELLEQQRADGWHDGAQCYVSWRGKVLLDEAIGESRPGRPLRADDLMLWYSAGKPLTTVAVLQLWERGVIGLDDPVADFVAGWGSGKERCSIRHVLTHTGGFPMLGDRWYDRDVAYDEVVSHIAAHPAEWEPGTRAAYHASSGWKILGAVVEAADGRTIDRYLHDEVLSPLGLSNCRLGIPPETQRGLGERIVPVVWRGHSYAHVDDGTVRMVPYHVEEIHNEPWHIAKVEPGGGMRGPARELGQFYESLLGHRTALLEPRTVEVMAAANRWGMRDVFYQMDIPWGLGVQIDFTGGTSRHTFGHNGMASSRAFADRATDLVVALVTNGLPDYLSAERRIAQITDAVYDALGSPVAQLRRPLAPVSTAPSP